jgi:cytochrome oxidase Cu insertion factor (SCO1/SenC/PrrC family)
LPPPERRAYIGRMSRAAQRGILIFAVGAVLLAGGLGLQYALKTGGALEGSGAASIGGDFTLVDQNGKTRTAADFRGRLMLLIFGFTYCPDVCPTELQTISEAIDLLGDKGAAVQPVFISVDPERDTPEQLRPYADSFHPRLVALTGSPEQVAQAARAYKVYYNKREQKDGPYLVDHSSFIFLMGRDGKYVMHFSPAATPEQIASAIRSRL